MENTYMLTTFDNPYNPFVDFASWYMFDCENDHNTSGRLARLSNVDNEMTEKEIDEERNRAIDFMLKYDFEGIYFKGTEAEIENWLKERKNSQKASENVEKTEENPENQAKNTDDGQ